eukprot:TRINITY_DN4473_c0_g1_i3.p1 TRINITY_DN4473_c0_g1~~TRINITY_DN4473_c0_g1_i3.p1  ORF type:complete len:232 (+),score=45.33 TRINITY_DN4473_c0_g1_i3:37-732(+)
MCSDSVKYCMLAVSTTVLYAVAICMVVVGSLNIYDVLPGCPSQPYMPHLNIIGGSIIMVGLFLRELLKRLCECCNDCCDYDRCCRIGGKVLKCSLTMIYDLAFMLVALFWLIIATSSLIRVVKHHLKKLSLGDEVNTALGHLNNFSDNVVDALNIDGLQERKDQLGAPIQGDEIECDEVLYLVTLVVIASGWIVLALGVLYFIFFKFFRHVLCCKTCREERPPPHHVYASV